MGLYHPFATTQAAGQQIKGKRGARGNALPRQSPPGSPRPYRCAPGPPCAPAARSRRPAPYPASSSSKLGRLRPRALRAARRAEICGSLSAAHAASVLQLQNHSSSLAMAPAARGLEASGRLLSARRPGSPSPSAFPGSEFSPGPRQCPGQPRPNPPPCRDPPRRRPSNRDPLPRAELRPGPRPGSAPPTQAPPPALPRPLRLRPPGLPRPPRDPLGLAPPRPPARPRPRRLGLLSPGLPGLPRLIPRSALAQPGLAWATPAADSLFCVKPTRAILSRETPPLPHPHTVPLSHVLGGQRLNPGRANRHPSREMGHFCGVFHSLKVFSFVFLSKHFRDGNLQGPERPSLVDAHPPRVTYRRETGLERLEDLPRSRGARTSRRVHLLPFPAAERDSAPPQPREASSRGARASGRKHPPAPPHAPPSPPKPGTAECVFLKGGKLDFC